MNKIFFSGVILFMANLTSNLTNFQSSLNNIFSVRSLKNINKIINIPYSRSFQLFLSIPRQLFLIFDHFDQRKNSRSDFRSRNLTESVFSGFAFLIFTLSLIFLCLNGSFSMAQEETIELSVVAKPGPPDSKSKSVRVTLQTEETNNQPKEIVGRLWADYRSEGKGMVALEDQMGRIHLLAEKDVSQIAPLDIPFESFNKKRIIDELEKEFGKEFQTYSTPHFIIIHHTSNSYAAWCGKLFETLYSAFEKYQSRKGFNLHHTELPMIAVVLGSKSEFEKYAAKDAPGAENIVAYYHRMNNRIVLYDLSGFESSAMAKKRSLRSIDAILSRPQAAYMVATIIHEATHQISFNRKMLLRSGPFPLWLSEGLSMYFETPDVDAKRGWSSRGIDRPNNYRLKTFNRYILTQKPAKPFQNVIQQEAFLENPNNSYAVSWALFYYLNEKYPKELVKYQEFLQKKIPFTFYPPEERLADFEKFFGNDWNQFYKDFSRFFQNLK